MHLYKQNLITCPFCKDQLQFKLPYTEAKVCFCDHVIARTNEDSIDKGLTKPMTEDMSPLKIGTRGTLERKDFEIVGRVRYNLKTGYRNFWSLSMDNTYLVISECYGNYSFLKKRDVATSEVKVTQLGAGKKIEIGKEEYYIDVVSIADEVWVEGEVGELPSSLSRFTSIEMSQSAGRFAMLDIFADKSVRIYEGAILSFNDFKFSNLRASNGWI